MRLTDLASRYPVEVVRDGSFESLGLLSHSRPRMLVFIEHEMYLPLLQNNASVACVITTEALRSSVPTELALCITTSPRLIFYTLHNYLVRETEFYWSDRPSTVSPSARVHHAAYVAERNVSIGSNVVIEPRATVMECVAIEADTIIRAGVVLGSEGFQVSLDGPGVLRVAHGGGVVIREGVEIQANSCIDRAVFGGATEIGALSSLADLVHVAHGVRVGRRARIAACAMIAGSVTLGDDVWIGAAAAISNEVTIGSGAAVSIGAVVTRDVPPGARVSGNFAIDHDRFLTFLRSIR